MEGAASASASVQNASLLMAPMTINWPMVVGSVILPISMSVSSSSNSSHGGTLSLSAGIYSRNGASISLIKSGSASYAWTNTSNNSQSLLTGLKHVTIPIDTTLSAGEYWLALWHRTSSTNANWYTLAFFVHSNNQTGTFNGPFLSSANSTSHHYIPMLGHYTASVTTAMPSNIPRSHVSQSGAMIRNYQYMLGNYTI
jgi:hypothetical protein